MPQFRITIHPAQIDLLRELLVGIGCVEISIHTVAPSLPGLVHVSYDMSQESESPEYMFCRGYFDAINAPTR